MFHRWDQLTFLHWSYDPAVIQALLPPGLTVDTFATPPASPSCTGHPVST